jgi:hypothetical protein
MPTGEREKLGAAANLLGADCLASAVVDLSIIAEVNAVSTRGGERAGAGEVRLAFVSFPNLRG